MEGVIFSILRILIAFLFVASGLYSQAPTAVIEFEGKGITQTEASALTDRLRSELFNVGFQVMERGLMEEILMEQGFQQTGCTSDECVVEVGKIIGVQQMVGGSISKVGNVFSVSARIVDVETGKILQMVTHDYEGDISGLLTSGMKDVATLLSGGMPAEGLPGLEAVGTLYISSDPPGANIWIDDVRLGGVTPLLVEKQMAGEHKIYVEMNDLSALTTERVEPNAIKRVNLTLGEAMGSINVFSDPLEAIVSIDGKEVGVTPLTIDALSAGEHKLDIEKPEYVRHTETILLKRNEVKRVEVYLEKMPLLSILTEPSGASLFINGKSEGTTPARQLKLSPGEYRIRLSMVDYESYETEVELLAGATEEISHNLVRQIGSLEITTVPSDASVYLDGEMKGNSPLTISEIPTGWYQVRATLNGYLPFDEKTVVQYKQSRKVEMSLTSIASVESQITAFQKKRNLWAGLALAGSVVGGYFKYSSYAHYQEYKTATTEAGELHTTIDRENEIYHVAFVVGAVCVLPVIYQHWKKERLERKLAHIDRKQ